MAADKDDVADATGVFGCVKKGGLCRVCKSLRRMRRRERNDEAGAENSLEPKLWPKLRLECAGLNFDRAQLARLNLRFASMVATDELEEGDGGVERARGAVEQATERLLQRLLCTVADLDARFSSKFLATLASKAERAEHRPWPGRRFHYMIRLDSLSWPPLYPAPANDDDEAHPDDAGDAAAFSRAVQDDGEGGVLPPGWIRVQPAQGAAAQTWAEFLTPSGCLRRDRVVERFAMLLSQAAGTAADDSETDESRVCGAPGKVLDAAVLQQMLCEVQPQHQLFYGPSEAQRCRPPDPRDFQVAVVHEGGSGPVLLRLGFLSPALQLAFPPQDVRNVLEVRLHVGVALPGWPADAAAFPARLPLHHPLALLAYATAQHGYFAVAVGPPPNLRCEERRSAWQAWFPGTEIELEEHFCAASTPRRAVRVLRHLCSRMRQEANDEEENLGGLLTVNDYAVRTTMWHQLERWTAVTAWEPASLAAHVLLALDALLAALKSRHASHFILPDCNILCQTPLDPSQIAKYGDHEEACDAAMVQDTQSVMDCLVRLHQASTSASPLPHGVTWDGEEEERRAAALEAALLSRWGCALNMMCPAPPEMAPPRPPWLHKIGKLLRRDEPVCAPLPEHFSPRQLDYLAQLMLEFLRFTKSCYAQQGGVAGAGENELEAHGVRVGGASEETEDFLFLMQAVVNQALGPAGLQHQAANKGKSVRRRRQRALRRDKQQVWREIVCDAVRREAMPIGILQDEGTLVCHLLKWLRRATQLAPRALRRRLADFTTQLWSSSREAEWHLPEWKKHREEAADEMRAMAAFCTMLLNSQEGWTGVAVLKDAAEKGWAWAKAAQGELVRSGCLQFVLAPAKGVVRRCDVALAIQPASRDTSPPPLSKKVARSRTLPAKGARGSPKISHDELTLRLGHRRGSAEQCVSPIPVHQRLRDGSPMTMALDTRRRHGQQLALSSLVHAFIAMHRISVLQEVAALLPPHERQPVLDALQKLSRARRQTRKLSAEEADGKFTMRNFEFSLHGSNSDDETESAEREARCEAANMAFNILGTCRNARTLQRRHSLCASFGAGALNYSSSPNSVRRRYAGTPSRQGVALLQLAGNGQLTLNPLHSDNDTSQIF